MEKWTIKASYFQQKKLPENENKYTRTDFTDSSVHQYV